MQLRRLLSVVLIGLLLFATTGGALAQEGGPVNPQVGEAVTANAGTAFTYQGELKDDSGLVNAVCDFQFGLFDAANSGVQLGSNQTVTNVTVANGRFTITLNSGGQFGARAFDGSARWLSSAVRCPAGSGVYTGLTPRQPLTAAPLAFALPGLRTEQNATSPNLIGGYINNTVSGGVVGATIAGGGGPERPKSLPGDYPNTVTANYGTVSGGLYNSAADYSTVGGGMNNTASGTAAFVGGGGWDGASPVGNTAAGLASTVGGGLDNTAGGTAAFIGGGLENTAGGFWATIAGGSFNTASGNQAVVGGGQGNTASNYAATVGGGSYNTASGLTAFVGGGGWDGTSYGGNTAAGNASTVGGGWGNTAASLASTIGGGYSNRANNNSATVSGGAYNTASGFAATVPGGYGNTASGDYSFAAGADARAIHNGSFVWANQLAIPISSTAIGQFLVRATGGISLTTNNAGTTGCNLSAGGGTWNCTSDRNAKANFAPVNGVAVLDALMAIPIQTWNFNTQDAGVQHMGPMAQDFFAAYGLGDGELTISTVDADGVALAAIQGLYTVVQEKDAEIAALAARVAALESATATSTSAPSSNTLQLLVVLVLGVVASGGLTLGAFALGKRQR